MTGSLVGRVVRTVLGPVPAATLGPTLVHEHLLIENPSFVEPDDPADRARARAPITLENLGWIRRHWTSHIENLRVGDEALAIDELRAFAAGGGGTVVDATVPGIGRDPAALVRMARATGVHVVMGAGAYIGPTHPDAIGALDVAALADAWTGEWLQGDGTGGVHPGLLGELGCSWPLQDRERVVLDAAARVQRATGAPVMVHPGRDPGAPAEIVRILDAAGADLGRVAIAHLDRTIQDLPGLLALARSGVWLEFDCFGLESSLYPFDPMMATLSDAQRIDLVGGLLDAGLGGRILLSHDICTRHRLSAYGGHGFGHLLGEVLPWMHLRGIDPADTTAMTVDNPARFLSVPSS